MDQLRKAYQRAIQAPINNVESIWQEYNVFENNLGKLTVRPRFTSYTASLTTHVLILSTRVDRPRSSLPSILPLT